MLDFARTLRAQATDAVRLVWSLLRSRRLGGFRLRRQHPFGPYILDFYCVQARLALEIDGGQHGAERKRRDDELRDEYLRSRGVRVLRFSNLEVLQETEAVLEAVWRRLDERVESRSLGRRAQPASMRWAWSSRPRAR